MVAGARLHIGLAHRGKVIAIIIEDSQFRVLHEGVQLSAQPGTVIKEVHRRSASGHANDEIQAGVRHQIPRRRDRSILAVQAQARSLRC